MRCVMGLNWWFVLRQTAIWPLSSNHAWHLSHCRWGSVGWTLPRMKKPSKWLFIIEDPPASWLVWRWWECLPQWSKGGDGLPEGEPKRVCCAWGGNTVCMVVAPCIPYSRHAVGRISRLRGVLPLPPHTEGHLPCSFANPGASAPCLTLPVQHADGGGPTGTSSPMQLKRMFHWCWIPEQLQIKWTGRAVVQDFKLLTS